MGVGQITFTSMFSHGGILHLLGNMLFLYLYGDNVEDAMGKARFFPFFLLCGITAFAQAFLDPNSRIPMVGASGAISGVIAAYLLLYPRANIMGILLVFDLFWHHSLTRLLNFGALGIRTSHCTSGIDEGSGWSRNCCSFGRFGACVILTPFFKKRKVKLFQKPNSRAFSRKMKRI